MISKFEKEKKNRRKKVSQFLAKNINDKGIFHTSTFPINIF